MALISDAIEIVDESVLRKGYEQISQSEYDGEIGDEDFNYTWEYFKELPSLYLKAAQARRAVLFTVDQ